MRKLGVLTLLVLPLLLGACSSGEAPKKPVYPSVINISGDFSISGATNVSGSLSQCAGVGPYADLRVGAPVSITTLTGTPVGIGKILYSVGTNVYRDQLDQCTFRYLVRTVARAPGYYIKVAQQHPYGVSFQALYINRGVYNMALPTSTIGTLPVNPLAPTVPLPSVTR